MRAACRTPTVGFVRRAASRCRPRHARRETLQRTRCGWAARFPQLQPHGSSPMSHAIPSRLFQTLKSHRWNCNVYGPCLKLTVLNYLRLLGGEPRKREGRGRYRPAAYKQRGRAHNVRPAPCRIRSPSPRPRCPRPRPSRRTSRNPRRSRGSRPRSGSGPPGSRGSRRSRRAGTGPRTPGS